MRAQDLPALQQPRVGIDREHAHAAVQLAQHVQQAPVGGELQVARAGAVGQVCRHHVVQAAAGGVKGKAHDPVGAQAGGIHEAAGGVLDDAMRRRAGGHDLLRRRDRRAARIQRQAGQQRAGVGGHQQVAPTAIDREVAGLVRQGGAADRLQGAIGRRDGEGHAGVGSATQGGMQHAPVGAHGQRHRGVGGALDAGHGCGAQAVQGAGVGVQFKALDLAALGAGHVDDGAVHEWTSDWAQGLQFSVTDGALRRDNRASWQRRRR